MGFVGRLCQVEAGKGAEGDFDGKTFSQTVNFITENFIDTISRQPHQHILHEALRATFSISLVSLATQLTGIDARSGSTRYICNLSKIDPR